MWIFGGDGDGKQIAMVNNCVLKRVGDLPFRMNLGTCAAIMDERIFMCFDQQDSKLCWHSDKVCLDEESPACIPNQKWVTVSSLFSHAKTRIASNKGF